MEEKKEDINPIGIYGWRKQFLYCLIILLIGVIVINVGVTVWIMVVLRFNIDGLGDVKITDDGIQVQGTAEFLDKVYLQSISADNQLKIQSQQNISLEASEASTSKIEMSSDSVTVRSDNFKIELNSPTADGANTLLSASAGGKLEFSTSSLHINGSVVDERITTKEILGLSNNGLLIEGLSFAIETEESILLNSENGPIDLVASKNITLSSNNGRVSIATGSVILEGLPTALPLTPGTVSEEIVYNLCMCPSGQLYKVLASAENTQGCLTSGNSPCN